ncbi:hypothetical protein AAC387_Pa09g1449 [Persea americana]|eukprot:TRINITY_DN52988_c0_g1_i1.p1 TRINITY_DN52988_c0_g1~~TRINITY_DN52988_c0_g1_i1.p1  ORF type:complete len:275 (-),score=26.07 TRINITY_DN52988_c0_g1_i1:123-947(-)
MGARNPHDLSLELPLTAAVAPDLTDEIDLTDISFKAGFQSLSLDTVMEITGLPLEKNKEAMKMMVECKKHTWKDKNLSQALQDYFTITSNLLLRTTKKEDQNNNGTLERFIQESQSLEQQLRAQYTKIGPKKRKYRILQFVASILAMMPLIGPLNLTIFVSDGMPPLISALLSFGFLAIGGIGSSGVWFCKRKERAMGVQEEVIGLVLMSMAFRNKDLSMQKPNFRKFEERQRKDRKIILQKLSELQESASPGWSIRPIEWGADNINSDRSVYN